MVADLMGIRCTACHGVVLGIRFVADMLWTFFTNLLQTLRF